MSIQCSHVWEAAIARSVGNQIETGAEWTTLEDMCQTFQPEQLFILQIPYHRSVLLSAFTAPLQINIFRKTDLQFEHNQYLFFGTIFQISFMVDQY